MNALGRLLEKIQSGGTLEVGALAAELETSPIMIEAMLEHLQRQGVVRACSTSGEACSACDLGTTCGIHSGKGLRVWQSVHQEAVRAGQKPAG